MSFFEKGRGRRLLADEPGLGKTIQTLAWISLHDEIRPVIVCPANVKYNWVDESCIWIPKRKVLVLNGIKPSQISFKYDVLILNYDILQYWVSEIKKWGVNCLVADEAHYLKNKTAKRTKAFKQLSNYTECVIGLTGTPVVNAPVEYYKILQIIDPDLFPNFWQFAKRYCKPKYNGFGWDFRGASNEEELYDILTRETGTMLRRKRADVQKQLAPITRTIIYLDPSSNFIGHDKNATGFADVEEAKQQCLEEKIKPAKEWIENYLKSGNKLVVFVWHRKFVTELKKEFPDALIIDGSVIGKERHDRIKTFQENKKHSLLIGNYKAAGIGINLTAAHTALVLEFPWTPSELEQAESRLNRMGQKNPVTVYYMIIKNSVEEKFIKILDKKQVIVSKVTDGKPPSAKKLFKNLHQK